jgi:Fe-coproporphyrin III synthase
MKIKELNNTLQRYKSLYTHRISSMPVVILMPHSSCNCRCRMCDIWKGNNNLKQLNLADLQPLLKSLRNLRTKQVLFSGGEALLHPDFFSFCSKLQNEGIYISLLSTGITLRQHAREIAKYVNELIISLDGNETVHNAIRNIPNAYKRLKEGIEEIRTIDAHFAVSGRTVIHKMNFRYWEEIIRSAHELKLGRISFLPADISSEAFNRQHGWDYSRQSEIAIAEDELPLLHEIVEKLICSYRTDIKSHFIAESENRLRDIYKYYFALNGLGNYPYKKCNAPWVSTVIEPDGNVRPCFFHPVIGNIRDQSLNEILNSDKAIGFRKNLSMTENETCIKCVCTLNLRPTTNPGTP